MANETKQDKSCCRNPNKRPHFLQRNLLCKKPTKDQAINAWHHKRKKSIESSKKLDPMRFFDKRLDEPVIKFRVIARILLHLKTPASNLFFILLVYVIPRKAVKQVIFFHNLWAISLLNELLFPPFCHFFDPKNRLFQLFFGYKNRTTVAIANLDPILTSKHSSYLDSSLAYQLGRIRISFVGVGQRSVHK